MGGFDLIGLLPLLLILAAVFVPMLVGRRNSPPQPPDEDPGDGDGGGGGGGPGPPTAGPPAAPTGGIPLPDAAQSRVRLRGGHERLADLLRRRERRRTREPERAPATAPR